LRGHLPALHTPAVRSSPSSFPTRRSSDLYRIIVLDALTYSAKLENLPNDGLGSERCEFWYGDVRNGELVNSLVGESDIVIHAAAETHVTRSIYDNRLFFETDVLGTQTVANAVAKHHDTVK